jgi:hypothetical protein
MQPPRVQIQEQLMGVGRTANTDVIRGQREPEGGDDAHALSPSARLLALTAADLADVVRLVLSANGAMWFIATGNSMSPAIPHRSRVHIRNARELRRGDVVLALTAEGPLVLHRVERIARDHIVLRGDSAVRHDWPIARESVLGVIDRVAVDGQIFPMNDRPGPKLRTRLARARATMGVLWNRLPW